MGIEDHIEIKRAGFVWEYAIVVNSEGVVEMLQHKDPAARCLLATWEAIEPETVAAMDAEAQEIADRVYKEWMETPARSKAYEFGFTR